MPCLKSHRQHGKKARVFASKLSTLHQKHTFCPSSRLAVLPLLGYSENMLASHLEITLFFPLGTERLLTAAVPWD